MLSAFLYLTAENPWVDGEGPPMDPPFRVLDELEVEADDRNTGGDLIKSSPRNQEPGNKIPRKVFWGILVLGSWFPGGDLTKSPLVRKKKGGDLIEFPPWNQEPRFQEKFLGNLGFWFPCSLGEIY